MTISSIYGTDLWHPRILPPLGPHCARRPHGNAKALAWCPFQGNLLASSGGGGDRCIKFWNTYTGACFNSVDAGSQVCALLWSKNERELLSSHGFTQNQLILWKYASMVKMAELTGHTSRVLFMAQRWRARWLPAAGDETLDCGMSLGLLKPLNCAKNKS
ncbi:hypothetical protein Nepgr_020289 [Nepenthes gracilis]|uniref:Uncharacterized protein n=1 Tax=Nepenthes gracilis TaxID=150966 RepID=A0AAD3XV40_NEPGR|nr:hypothetical protein Nepgr_020289 [Nepenthes gracilis]